MLQLSEEQARSELFSSTQRLQANIDPNKHHIGDQLAGILKMLPVTNDYGPAGGGPATFREFWPLLRLHNHCKFSLTDALVMSASGLVHPC